MTYALIVLVLILLVEVWDYKERVKDLERDSANVREQLAEQQKRTTEITENMVGMAWDVHSLQFNQELFISEHENKGKFAPIDREY